MKKYIALVFAGFALTSQAVEYKAITPEKSKVTFNYKQMGVPMDGSFKRFAVQLNFDPAKPATAKAQIDIDLASVDTGSYEADDELAGKTWFNTKTFPHATFVSKQIKATGANQFDAIGELTIKGKTQEVKLPIKYAVRGASGTFTGTFVLKRSDFAIGEGSWSKFDVVANEIQVNFQISANANK